MSRKVITPCEGLLACFTLKWTFIGVAAKMSRKASTHCEGLLAYITLQRASGVLSDPPRCVVVSH